jgi:hypothetical protein
MSQNETPKLETFTLVKERCTLANLNIRTEMHGDERQRAVDLQFDFSGANNLLAKLHPDLRHAFYKQQDTQDMLSNDHTPVLRFPLMGPISWDLEIPRTRLQLHGETPADDVVLGDGKTNKFKLTLMDGGTVKWHFRVQFSNPDDKAIAGLSRFLNDTVPVSLECRSVDEDEGDNFDQVEKLSQAPMSEARQKAEDLFAQGGDPVDNLFATPGTDLALATPESDPDFREVAGSGDAVVFPNDGTQPGDAGHSYAGEDTVTVESVRASENGDVVDATFIPDAEQVETEPVSIVTPIGKGRRGGRKVAGGSLE